MNILKQRTFVAKPDKSKKWYCVDASNQVLGRLSTEIANILRGKNKPSFTPHLDCGDFVVVTNAKKIRLTGKKWTDKTYYQHSGHVGGLKAQSARDVLNKHPERLIMESVKGMLPPGKLSRQVIKKLRVYADDKHAHDAQKLTPLTLRIQ
ncbi:MAG: 50S ribosomal protein L13 [Deltaproteobacteria bacterium]|nr:50S ribosomal protein L13 [Deltaproteobacteria bacterium]MBI3017255.1 50S ribosomal protein L13 [Deltaproteobacteria bacterium]